MMHILISLLMGSVAGLFSGLFGIGGGIIIVPMLILIFKFQPQLASATSLVIFLLPVGVMGVWKYYQLGVLKPEQFKMGLLMGLGLIMGSYLGASLSPYINALWLQRSFAVVLVIVAYQMWVKV